MIVHVAITRPHPWQTVREVVHVSAIPCTRPVRVTAGHGDKYRIAWVDCARRLSANERCRPCTTRVVIEPSALVFPEDGHATR